MKIVWRGRAGEIQTSQLSECTARCPQRKLFAISNIKFKKKMKLSSLLIISLLLLQHNKGRADKLQKALIDSRGYSGGLSPPPGPVKSIDFRGFQAPWKEKKIYVSAGQIPEYAPDWQGLPFKGGIPDSQWYPVNLWLIDDDRLFYLNLTRYGFICSCFIQGVPHQIRPCQWV